jgi:RNA polymerase sigma factor (sigma-70 family)
MTDTDLELLADYNRQQAEDAFAELVRRHLGLVYSAALRQVRSPQLAEEVSQSVFTDLARHAGRLKPGTILSAWLYQVTRRTAIDVIRREASRQLREQVASGMYAMNANAADWTDIEPLLDEAMHALGETDRAAVLLRYFENKSLREVGDALGASENAAQKRLTRAMEQLRGFFAKHGVTVGASGLVVVISTNAVQAAPVELAITISSAAVVAGTTVTTAAATGVAAKIITMTTLQKTIIGAVLATAIGAGIFKARQISGLRGGVQTPRQTNTQLTAENKNSLRMSRNLKASPQLVFDAFTKPELLGKWMFPNPQARFNMDVRVGGKWSITNPNQGMEVTASGTYIEVKPPFRLVYTFAIPQFSPNTDTITIEIAPTDNGCSVTLIQSGVDIAKELKELPPGQKGGSQTGYEQGFESLAKILERP